MKPTVLLHCSNVDCPTLIYLDEAVPGKEIDPSLHGRYCVDCAREMGYYTEYDIAMLEHLLVKSGLLSPTDPTTVEMPMPAPHPQLDLY
jgi:hypothetical protein